MTEDELLLVELAHGAMVKGLPRDVAYNAAFQAATKNERKALVLASVLRDPIERELMLAGNILAIAARLSLAAYWRHKAEKAARQ